MKTKYVIKGFFKNETVYFVENKVDKVFNTDFDVKLLSPIISGATLYNSYSDALDTIREYNLLDFDAYPVCPICGEAYDDHPAISRKDNKTEICSSCGIGEAFMDFMEHNKNEDMGKSIISFIEKQKKATCK